MAPPADTADHHLRPEPPSKNLPFPSCGRRVSPIQAASCHLQSGHGECLPATQLYLSVFTCPTVSLDLPSDAGESLPARQPYLFHPSYPTDGEYFPPVGCRREPPGHTSYFLCLYLSNAASLDLPLDAGEVLPARQSYYSVFTCPTQRVLISRWTPARCSRPDNLTFFCLYLSNTASLDLPLDAGEVLPARQSYFLCLYLSNTASPDISLDAGEVLPARQSYFSCLHLSNTASLNLPLDAGEVLPARQMLFRLLAPKISNPVERDIPSCFGNLSFQSTINLTSINLTSDAARASRLDNLTFSSFVSEANPSNRRACPPVGCRLSIPTKLYLSVFTCPTQ